MVNQPAKVGRGLRTIALNIAAMSEETDTWTAANGRVNVALKDQQGNMRNTYDIMNDLYNGVEGQSVAWNQLNEAEQTAIAESVAGKNQFEVFTAVMGNFKNAVDATNTALHSTGSAEKENQKAMDSIEGRLQRLRSAFEYFAYKTINSDWIKSVIDAGSTMLEFLGSDMGQGVLKLTAIGTGVLGVTKAFAKLKNVVSGLSFGEAISTLIFGSKSVTEATEEAAEATAKYTAAEATASTVFSSGAKSKSETAKAIGKTATATSQATKSTTVFSKAWSGLTGLVKAHPFMAVAAGVAATTVGITKFVEKYNESFKAYDKTTKKIQENASEIDNLRKKTNNLTDAEQDRLLQLQANNKALEEQSKQEAKAALKKATKNYISADGDLKGISGVGKSGRQRTGIKAIESDIDTVKKYQSQLQNINQELEKSGNINQWKKDYKDTADKIYDVVDAYDTQIKAFEDAEKAHIPLTESEKELWQSLKLLRDGAKDTHNEYQELLSQEQLMAKAEDWIPDAKELSKTEMGYAQLEDRMDKLNLAMNRTGDDGRKAFNELMDGIDGGYKSLGKFNKETGKYEFDNSNLKDYAKQLGLTEEAAQELLKTQTKSGLIEWKIPKKDFKNFNKELKDTSTTIKTTEGNMIATKSSIEKLGNSLGIPEAAMPEFINKFTEGGNTLIDFSNEIPQVIDSMSQVGESFGMVTDQSGKLQEVDLNALAQGVHTLGGSATDLSKIIAELNNQDISMTGDYSGMIDGVNSAEVAAQNLMNQLNQLDGTEVDAEGSGKGLIPLQDMIEKIEEELGGLDNEEANPKIEAEGVKQTENDVDQTKDEINSLDDTKGTGVLDAEDNTEAGVGSAESNIAGFDGEQAQAILAALNNTYPGLAAAMGTLGVFSGMPFAALLTANDNASGTTDKATGTAESFAKDYNATLSAQDNASSTIQSIISQLAQVRSKTVTVTVKKSEIGQKATGKRKGESGGLAWVGDEGSASNPKPELIETKDGAYLAGTQGWELVNLSSDDVVHTATETKKLLGTKFKNLFEAGNYLPRFAKGKKNTFQDKVDKVQEQFDNAVSKLEWQRDYNNWSDSTFNKKYKALYDKYQRKARKIKKGKKRGSLSGEQKRDMQLTIKESQMEYGRENIESRIDAIEAGNQDVSGALALIDKERKARRISAEEAKKYKQEVYKASAEYALKEYENGNKTYAEMKKTVDRYYANISHTTAEYYEMQENLANAAKEREIERLEKEQEKQEKMLELGKLYVDQQIDFYDKQIEKQEQLNEEQEQLNEKLELEADLAKAKSQRVRIYREGMGFQYEQDTESIREAQKALDEFNAEQKINELEKAKQEWEEISDLISDLETEGEIKGLENDLGITAEALFGSLGTDIDAWTARIKNYISSAMGYEDAIEVLESQEGYNKIFSILSKITGTMSSSAIQSYINKNKFASGTLSASGGLSLVGENGAELRVLNKGDGILPSNITSNLMALGQLNPTQWESAIAKNIAQRQNIGSEYHYNFDKLILPNVQNANDLVSELRQLPNRAIQSSRRRN